MAAGTIGTTPLAPTRQPTPRSSREAYGALRGIESIGAAAGQDDGVHAIHHVERVEQVGFAGAWRATALCDAARGAITVDDDDANQSAVR